MFLSGLTITKAEFTMSLHQLIFHCMKDSLENKVQRKVKCQATLSDTKMSFLMPSLKKNVCGEWHATVFHLSKIFQSD